MMQIVATSWQQARREPFEGFGILYYPLFRSRADLPTAVDDADMAWAVTANANLEGTGYTLSQPSILTLAAYHKAMADLAQATAFLPLASVADEGGINPLSDIKRLVPDVKAKPMYPDFPQQVMEISEAQFRYDQACHYLSTYGVEALSGALGLDVTVSQGWMPDVEDTEKTREDETLLAPKVLHLLVTLEDLQSVVAARLARATRMHETELTSALLAFGELGGDTPEEDFPKIAFHENMMELIRRAAWTDSATLEHVAAGFAQHPGDLLKAVIYLLESKPKKHLHTRQKKGFCRAFEHFSSRDIAQNIADANRKARLAPNYLSVARFGGPHLREAIELVDSGKVRAWNAVLEDLWLELDLIYDPRRRQNPRSSSSPDCNTAREVEDRKRVAQAWRKLLSHYGQRPGMLFRSLGRLAKAHCPHTMLSTEVMRHAQSYALPTLVRTLTIMSEYASTWRTRRLGYADFEVFKTELEQAEARSRKALFSLLRQILLLRLRALETPLRGKRVYLDTAGISLMGSVLMPNETGNTGTAWPPVGMAFDLPTDKRIRFFTYWDDKRSRVDVDLHFFGRTTDGQPVHVGWNSKFRSKGMITSGDITSSHDSVEFLDADMREAREQDVLFVMQEQHVFSGRKNWRDIETCYSGAVLVDETAPDVKLINPENLIFRDDLTGDGSVMAYAVVNFPNHYVRIMRGADLPLGDPAFSLDDYLKALFEAQEVTLVETPEEAELRVCVGRSDDPEVISLFDEGFFIG